MELLKNDSANAGDYESCEELKNVVPGGGIGSLNGQLLEPPPENQHYRQGRSHLDYGIEDIGPGAESKKP